MSALVVLLTLLAGAVGAVARYALDRAVTARSRGPFPLGILAVNILGSLLLGVLVGLVRDGVVPTAVLTVAGTGLLGAFTTFSTFAVHSVELAERGRPELAVRTVGATVLLCVTAAGAGLALAAAWSSA